MFYKTTRKPKKVTEMICGIPFKIWNTEINKRPVKAERWFYYDN